MLNLWWKKRQEITTEDSNKTIMQKILQKNSKVCKLGDKHYAYKGKLNIGYRV